MPSQQVRDTAYAEQETRTIQRRRNTAAASARQQERRATNAAAQAKVGFVAPFISFGAAVLSHVGGIALFIASRLTRSPQPRPAGT